MQFVTRIGILILTLVVQQVLNELTLLISRYLQSQRPTLVN